MYIWTKIKVVQQFLVPRRSDMVYHRKRVEWKIVNVFFFKILSGSRGRVIVQRRNGDNIIYYDIRVEYIIKRQVLQTSCRPLLLKSLQNNNFNIHYTVLDRIMNNCINTKSFFLTRFIILFFVVTSNKFCSIYYNQCIMIFFNNICCLLHKYVQISTKLNYLDSIIQSLYYK